MKSSSSLLVSLLIFLTFVSFSISFNEHGFLTCLVEHTDDIPYFTPENPYYQEVLNSGFRNSRFNQTSATTKPRVIVTPKQIRQVQNVVRCARKNKAFLRIRSVGYGLEGLSYRSSVPPFVILDLQYFQNVNVDVKDQSAWVQSGATVGQLYYTVANKSGNTLGFSTTVGHNIGIGGTFSGAGYGMMMRKYGLSADRIIDVHVIDARGRFLDRSNMTEDHFWAIRGGGGNTFGVVIAWKIKLMPTPNPVTVFKVTRSRAQNLSTLIHLWSKIAPKMDENIMLRFLPSKGNFTDKNQTTYETALGSFTALYLGPKSKLSQLMKNKFPELGLSDDDYQEVTWVESALFFDGFNLSTSKPSDMLARSTSSGYAWKIKSDYLKEPIPISAAEGILDKIDEIEPGGGSMCFTPYGGEMEKISESSIPFSHRKGRICEIEYVATWSSDSGEEVANSRVKWVRSLHEYMTPYVSSSPRESYMNHRDLDIGCNDLVNPTVEQARIWGVKFFNDNFERLVDAKTAVDPTNFFRNEQSIPPRKAPFLISSW